MIPWFLMSHTVSFENILDVSLIISRKEISELIDLLYAGPDAEFIVVGDERPKRRGQRGLHQLVNGIHRISLSLGNIRQGVTDGTAIGGNFPTSNIKMGVALVLAHEIQHGNQSLSHDRAEGFFQKRGYRRRPCEIDARAFVDANTDVISQFVGIDCSLRGTSRERTQMTSVSKEIELIADELSELEDLSVKDLVEELRACGLANPKNVELLRAAVTKNGTKVSSQSSLH